MNPDFHIALCCNGTMLPGLHATLASLVSRLGQRQSVSLTIFTQDIKEDEVADLEGTVSDAGGVGALKFQQANPDDFKDLRTLHGSWMIYVRLLLPNLLPDAKTILYLDSDLVIGTDACAFFNHDLGSAPLGAVNGTTVEWSLDREFLKLVGLKDTDRTFNSGVLLFNVEMWKKSALVERALEMARTYSDELISHDQSVLNAMFSRSFYEIPVRYNMGVTPEDKAFTSTDCIYHFVGSPKPWDPFGKFLHGNWRVWNSVIINTRFKWSKFLSRHFSAYAQRAWTLRRSYARTLRRRQEARGKVR